MSSNGSCNKSIRQLASNWQRAATKSHSHWLSAATVGLPLALGCNCRPVTGSQLQHMSGGGEEQFETPPASPSHYEKYPPSFCPGRSNGSLGFNAKGPPGRPGAPLVGNLSGLARARGPGPMSPRCLAQIVTPACKLSTLRHRSGGGCNPALTPVWNSMWVVIG